MEHRNGFAFRGILNSLAGVFILLQLILPGASSNANAQGGQIKSPGSEETVETIIREQKGPTDFNQLLERVRREGKATVIVGLELEAGFQPEGELTASNTKRQRDHIFAVQQLLIEEMAGYQHKVRHRYKYIPYISMEVDERSLSHLWNNPKVTTIEQNMVVESQLKNSIPKIGAKAFHDFGVSGNGYTIAVIDSGIDETHPAFWVDPSDQSKGTRIVREACFSSSDPGKLSTCPGGMDAEEGVGSASVNVPSCNAPVLGNICEHGTYVSGIIAGNGGMEAENIGVAPEANLIAIQTKYRVDDPQACGGYPACVKSDTEDLLAGLEKVYDYAISDPSLNVAAVNISQGSKGVYFGQTCDSANPAFTAVVDQLVSIGIPVIASSGNENKVNQMTWPACMSKVLSVAAVDIDDNPYDISQTEGNNTAEMLDFFAPGVDITSTAPLTNESWLLDTGTSAAAPHVSGSWTLIRQAVPGASYADILTSLRATGVHIEQHGITRRRINVLAAVEFLDSTSPGIPSLVSPNDNARTSTARPLFEWNGTIDSILYDLQISRNNSFTDIVFDDATIQNSSFTSPLLAEGMYYWRVSGRDLAGNWSDFSAYRTVVIDTSAPNPPPLQSPSNQTTINDSTPTLDWTAVSGAGQYLITVDNNSNFLNPEINVTRSQTQSSSYTPATALTDNQYFWKVRAIDSVGNYSESDVWTFRVDTVPPSVPVLAGPGNNDSMEDTTPFLDWNDSSGNPEQYQVQVDNNSDFSSPVVETSASASSYQITSPMTTGSYTWRVKAGDAAGNWSNYSAAWLFTIATVSNPPISFGKLLPAHQTYDNPADVTLIWGATSSNATIKYCLDQTDNNQCDNNTWLDPTTKTSVTLSGLNPGMGYFWQVKATNGFGTTYANGSETAWWWFVTKTPQSDPLLINEIDVGPIDSVEIYNPNTQSVELSGWYLFPFDTNGSLEQYYLFPNGFVLPPGAYVVVHEGNGSNSSTDLYTGSIFSWEPTDTGGAVALTTSTKGIDYVRWGNSTEDPPTGTVWNGTNPSVPMVGASLGRVSMGLDSDDGSDWCTQAPSMGASNPGCNPLPFGKNSPSDNSSDQPINIDLSWEPTIPATKYEYCLDEVINQSCDTGWVNNGTNTSISINALGYSNTYEWQVRARNGTVGLTYANSTSSSFWRFSTQNPPPPAPPNGVAASDHLFTDRIRISWTASPSAAFYDVYRALSDSSASATKINATPIPSGSYDDTTAGAGIQYFYWIKACNSNGCSGFSSYDTGTRAAVSTYEVLNANASGSGSLSQILLNAPSGATITFSPSLAGQTIRPSATFVINKDLVINASKLSSPIIISGDTDNDSVGDIRLFQIDAGMNVTFSSLIIEKGAVPSGQPYGAGIYNQGNLTLSHCQVRGHQAGGVTNAAGSSRLNIVNCTISNNQGYGVLNNGTLDLIESTISNNNGNGIYNGSGVLTVLDTHFLENHVLNRGGGIYNTSGTIYIRTSTFESNYGHYGGGIYNGSGNIEIINSTFYANAANYYAGGIYNGGTLRINNTTISDSYAPTGGGIYNAGSLNISNTILANTKEDYPGSFDDCRNAGGLVTVDSTWIELDSQLPNNCDMGMPASDPMLELLLDNGGRTPTMALNPHSPVIDAGNDSTCESSDQRGVTRPYGAHCDIGAFEHAVLDYTPPNVTSVTRADPNPTSAASVSFTVTFSESVTGVTTDDFTLYTTGGVTGATVTGVSGSGTTYKVILKTGAGDGTIRLNVTDDDSITDAVNHPLGGPGTGNGSFTGGETYTIKQGATFTDVPTSHPFYHDIEILYASGLTGGCSTSPLKFCPDQIMNRAQAAVFMVRGAYGAGYVPNPTAYKFKDNWSKVLYARPWAEAMRETNLTTGCKTSPLLYCPLTQLNREQAVIFGLKMKYGTYYQPPPATGTVFADMTNPSYWATAWAEKAYADGLIAACGTLNGKPKFCPNVLVTRGLGAYIIVRAKNLTLP